MDEDALRTVAAAALLIVVVSASVIVLGVVNAGTPRSAVRPPVPVVGSVDAAFHARLDSLEARVAAEPGDTGAALLFARLLQDAHRPAEAAARYTALLERAGARRDLWLELAGAHAAAGDPGGARLALEQVLARWPEDPTALYDLGVLSANAGDSAAAATLWRRVAAQDRDSATAAAARHSLRRLAGGGA